MTTLSMPGAMLRGRWTAERRFYTWMSLAILAGVALGFSRSFYLHALFPAHPVPPEPFFVLHGLVFTAWFLLLPAQSLLVASGRVALHRRVGAAVAVAMVILGVHGALLAGVRPGGFVGVPVPGWQFMIVPLAEMVIFPAFVALAVAKRRDAQAHKRWMLLASIAILPAACARWPGIQELGNPVVFFVLADLFLVPLVVWDLKTRGRLHPATLWGGLVLVASQPLRLALSGTPAWQAFAEGLLRLAS
jgi:Na+-transporting NADH:ubiquinone oxidoreductase subunit NqrB